jgi:hypothetical protein
MIPFILYVNSFVQNITPVFFFINDFIKTASYWLLWVGNMTVHVITNLLKRRWFFSTWALEEPSSLGINVARWRYHAQAKIIKYMFLKVFWGMCYCSSFHCFLYTDCMELSHSWEAISCAPTLEFPNILWNLNVHYHVHKSSPLATIVN